MASSSLAKRRQNDNQGGEPDHAGAIAVVRVGQRAARKGIAQNHDNDKGGEFADGFGKFVEYQTRNVAEGFASAFPQTTEVVQ